jgi:hypothetical protein
MEVILLPTLPKLDHLYRLTDRTGIIQHATYNLPDLRTGYTTDDNARALTCALKLWELNQDPQVLALAETYLSFLVYTQRQDGLWHNFVDYSRRFLDGRGSDDSFGRAVQSICTVAAKKYDNRIDHVALELLERAKKQIPSLSSPRAMAFTMIGLAQLGKKEDYHLLRQLADNLSTLYRIVAGEGWYWFEEYVTYCNGALPQAMLLAYQALGKKSYLHIGLESLAFLSDRLLDSGKLTLVGNQGWWHKGGMPAVYDQQPVDAAHLVAAHLAAYQLTGQSEHHLRAQRCYAWFEGDNSLGLSLIDPVSGGCFDGLTPESVNRNQGAESLLAYLEANLCLSEVETKRQEATG